MAVMTSFEWYMLELVNRARLDPLFEAKLYGLNNLNAGLTPGTITATPKSPLAPDDLLTDAARGHSNWMLANDAFDHTGQNGSQPFDRMQNAGYNFTTPYGAGENLSGFFTTGTLTYSASLIEEQHKGLFLSAEHRANILNDSFKQLGIGQVIGGPYTYNGTTYNEASLITQNYAYSAAYGPWFITGAHWTESGYIRFYTPGEGHSGTSITITPAGGGTAQNVTTQAHGGYAAAVSNGTYNVTFYNASFSPHNLTATVTVNNANVKLDLVADPSFSSTGPIFQSSADIVLPANPVPVHVVLLGAVNANATGNADANIIIGSRGANTLDGQGGNDYIWAGEGDDTLYGRAGNDTLQGKAGDDTIDGGDGNDTINGGGGADTITGGTGDDRIYGGNGNDTISGNDGVDKIKGNAGNDAVSGGAGNDWLFGGGGNDTLRGGSENDRLYGQNGNDTLEGEAGADRLKGHDGDDELYGGSGNDALFGHAGSDVLSGGNDKDWLLGGAGDDWLWGGPGSDRLWGQGGSDTFFYQAFDGTDIIKDFEDNVDWIDFSAWGFSSVNQAMSYAVQKGAHVKFDFSSLQPGDALWVLNITTTALADDITV